MVGGLKLYSPKISSCITKQWRRSGVFIVKFEHIFYYSIKNWQSEKIVSSISKSWRHSGVFLANFEHIPHLFLMFRNPNRELETEMRLQYQI